MGTSLLSFELSQFSAEHHSRNSQKRGREQEKRGRFGQHCDCRPVVLGIIDSVQILTCAEGAVDYFVLGYIAIQQVEERLP